MVNAARVDTGDHATARLIVTSRSSPTSTMARRLSWTHALAVGLFRKNEHVAERMMDSMDLEREKGIRSWQEPGRELQGRSQSTSWTRRAPPTRPEVERTLTLGTGCCCSWMREGRCRRRASCSRSASGWGLRPSWSSKRSTAATRGRSRCDEVYDLFSTRGHRTSSTFPSSTRSQDGHPATRALRTRGTTLEPALREHPCPPCVKPRTISIAEYRMQFRVAMLDWTIRGTPHHRPHRHMAAVKQADRVAVMHRDGCAWRR